MVLKNKIIYKLISFLLLIVFITPIVISSFHHHKDEEHLFCDKNDVTHLHKIEIDNCNAYHYQLTSVLLFQTNKIEKVVIKNLSTVVLNYTSFYKNNTYLLRLLRGPPCI